MFKQAKNNHIITILVSGSAEEVPALVISLRFLSKADDILFYKVGEVVNESLFPILSGLTLMQGCHCRPSPCSL